MEEFIKRLHELASAAGVSRNWWDVDGKEQIVSDEALATILAALGYPATSETAISDSLAQIEQENSRLPVMIVTEVNIPTPLPPALGNAEITTEDGTVVNARIDCSLPPISEPGYYRMRIGQHSFTLAVAPTSCPDISAFSDTPMWGAGIQIPALRGEKPQPFGNFGNLQEAVELFARRGADAIAINPVHALFPGYGIDFSPYSPSSRRFLNGAMGDPALLGLPPIPPQQPGTEGVFIDWETALPQRLDDLRRIFDELPEETRTTIAEANAAEGEELYRQAVFDALDRYFRPGGAKGWHDWPADYRNPDNPTVQEFSKEHAEEVEFGLFVQWLARESLASVQAGARENGMAIGLIADLAVGVHTGGSDAWSMQGHMLEGLTIGAPPDPLGPHGQNWALTTFSPRGLRETGYAPWIETLRSALNRSGGLRIDHAFGLERLWVVPAHRPSSDGAYLSYPFKDLLRLTALEAHRAGALIIAEDLGTMPWGFGEAIAEKRLAGMRVLWFERAEDDGFVSPQDYAPDTVAMTGTHDTATVAGWWSGRDLDWAERLHRFPEGSTREEQDEKRAWDRGLLWAALDGSEPRPEPDDPEPVVDAALRHIGRAKSQLAIAPLEDLLALEEQPNLPGTIDEHPNWRRRLCQPVSDLLAEPHTAKRIASFDQARKASAAHGGHSE